MTVLAPRTRSIRTHILWMVLVGAILPLALVGAWLTASAIRAGRSLLDQQLEASLQAVTSGIAAKWAFRQSDLILLADNSVARRLISGAPLARADSEYLERLRGNFSATIPSFVFRDLSGRIRWTNLEGAVVRVGSGTGLRDTPRPSLTISVPTHDSSGKAIGSLDARVLLDTFVPVDSGRLIVPGSALAVRDRTTGVVLRSLSPQTDFVEPGERTIDGATWMSVTGTMASPAIDLAVAAPTAPYVAPFLRAGRIGSTALALVVVVALSLSVFLTGRIARPLEHLVSASTAIAEGDLDRRVDSNGPTEIQRLTASFNIMAESVRRSMDELSRRSALAAVGEFAASLAHEVRNALTSLRLDLQRAEEKLPRELDGAKLVWRSVETVRRLDATVTGALQVARSGSVHRRPVDIREVLDDAARDVAHLMTASGHRYVVDVAAPIVGTWCLSGDPVALHQLFLNLLLNAVQALPGNPPGEVRVSIARAAKQIVVTITDNGTGMSSESLERIFEPFFTTRESGTGLGLPIARQIAVAHDGTITAESQLGVGSTVRVSFNV